MGRGYAAGFASLVGGLMLLFFAAAARSAQRSGEASESSYSSVAHAGLVGAGVGLAFQGLVAGRLHERRRTTPRSPW